MREGFSVKSFSRKFSWNWFHGKNSRCSVYMFWNHITGAAAETHPFPFFKVLYSFLFLLSIFSSRLLRSARLPLYFQVSNFFSLLFLLDKKWIGNFSSIIYLYYYTNLYRFFQNDGSSPQQISIHEVEVFCGIFMRIVFLS